MYRRPPLGVDAERSRADGVTSWTRQPCSLAPYANVVSLDVPFARAMYALLTRHPMPGSTSDG
ncbi:hypothetical protein EXIGLDRAFT_735956 [Exidia glandulosa HHB12029]|uniref:Uncharacterized protein n=1 Tax=Exidia glandulosa HHB12029 TaxID=1314781 RepID=A0A166NCJ5_EXIGL|nr:hypothetical protein EXIGLDRAFT_735956 [Exidia glandulosa HHB12029]